MKKLQKYHYWVACTALVLGVCGIGWHFEWLTHVGFIGLLVASLVALLGMTQLLLFKLHQAGALQTALQHEVSRLKSQVSQLMKQAYYDNLTGLGNRNLLNDRFQFVMERSMRSKASFALMMIDLNRFKLINDTYGHIAGDAVLIACAKRLVASARASDTVVRLGGDEFLLLIEGFENHGVVRKLGHKLIDALSQDIVLPTGETVSVGASVGIAHYPQDGADMHTLMEYADQSMYACKTSGHMPLDFG